MAVGASFVFYNPRSLPLNAIGLPMPGATMNFYFSGTLQPAPVYADAMLGNQFPPTDLEADAMGRFPTIYLDSTIQYRYKLYDQNGILQDDEDPINTPAVGIVYAATKQLTTQISTTSPLAPDPELSLIVPVGTYIVQAFIQYESFGGLACSIFCNTPANSLRGGFVFTGVSVNQPAPGGQTVGARSNDQVIWDTGSSSFFGYIAIGGSITLLTGDQLSFNWAPTSAVVTQVNAGSSLYLLKIA